MQQVQLRVDAGKQAGRVAREARSGIAGRGFAGRGYLLVGAGGQHGLDGAVEEKWLRKSEQRYKWKLRA